MIDTCSRVDSRKAAWCSLSLRLRRSASGVRGAGAHTLGCGGWRGVALLAMACFLVPSQAQGAMAPLRSPDADTLRTWEVDSGELAAGWRVADVDAVRGSDVVSARTVRYTVAAGDTLGHIAEAHGVRVSDLRTWNNLQDDRIQVGQVLTIRSVRGAASRERREYRVRAGDTGLAIARSLSVSFSDLQRWNSRVDFNRLQIGQRLVYFVPGPPAGRPGTPQRGRLVNGVQLEPGPGYRVRAADRAWGTALTVTSIRDGYARLAHFDPEKAPVLIADISYERGGPIRGHSSHQNGLDVDATYYILGEEEFNDWRAPTPENLDVERQWYLFRQWLLAGVVEYIFMEFALQQPLYEYARARGASDEELEEWFQYPNRSRRSGIIRHEPGHHAHYHVRFHQR